MAGDVIGCTFDLDNGDIAYYRYAIVWEIIRLPM